MSLKAAVLFLGFFSSTAILNALECFGHRYASIDTHLGVEQARRDDMECLGFVLMYFLRGSLPWQGLKANTKKLKYQRILEKKQATHPEQLCRGYPSEFRDYFAHVSSLGFEDRPDYRYLKTLFRDLYERNGYADDGIFDWDMLEQKKADNSAAAVGGARDHHVMLAKARGVLVAQPERTIDRHVGLVGEHALKRGDEVLETLTGAVVGGGGIHGSDNNSAGSCQPTHASLGRTPSHKNIACPLNGDARTPS